MATSVAFRNRLLAAHGITHVALYHGDPMGAGVQVGDRAQITWGAPDNGVVSATNQPVIDVPGGSTTDFIALFDAASGGSPLAAEPKPTDVHGSPGPWTLTSATITLVDAE